MRVQKVSFPWYEYCKYDQAAVPHGTAIPGEDHPGNIWQYQYSNEYAYCGGQ